MPDTSTPIFVLRGSFTEFQHTVLGMARSVGRLGVPVYATTMDPREPAVRSRYVRGVLQPDKQASEGHWLEALLQADTGGRPALMVPIDDVSAVFVDDHHTSLSERFLLPKAPGGLYRQLASKRGLSELCQHSDVPAPASSFPESEDELWALSARYGYPVVLKQSDPWLASFDPSAPSVLIAHSASELVDGYRRMESSVRPQVIIQEYIPGDTETIWMFNGYFNRNSECLCAFTGQKLRQRGPGTGPTTLGVCTWNQEVGDAATSLMREVGYHGIVDMGFRYDERDGRYKLLDVNPRLGSTFRLFVGENGVDVLRAAYLDLTGQRVPFTRAPNGRRWLAEPYDIVAAAQLVGQRQLRPSAWLRSLGDVAELAWWARDDPLPFLAMIASLPPQGWRYRTRRRARLRSTALAGLKPASSQPTSGASR